MTSNFEQYGPPKQERNYADLLDQYAQTRRFDDRTEEIYFDIYRNQSLPRHVRIAARNRIAANHIPFVIKVASSYWSKNSERGDIVDVGIAGLVRAIDSFSYGHGVRFISYAVWWIRQAITKYLADDELIHVPLNQKITVRKLLRESRSAATPEEILSESRSLSAALSAMNPLSMNSPTRQKEAGPEIPLGDTVHGPDLMEELCQVDFEKSAASVLDLLGQSDRETVAQSYGIGYDPQTFTEIGKSTGRSHEWIRQKRKTAIRKLAVVARKSNLYRELAGLEPLPRDESYNIKPDSAFKCAVEPGDIVTYDIGERDTVLVPLRPAGSAKPVSKPASKPVSKPVHESRTARPTNSANSATARYNPASWLSDPSATAACFPASSEYDRRAGSEAEST